MKVAQHEFLVVVSFGWSNWREDDKTIFEFPWVVLDTQTLKVTDSGVHRIKPSFLSASDTSVPAISSTRLTMSGLSLADLEDGLSFPAAVQKFNNYLFTEFVQQNKSFCLVVENSWDLTYCFVDEAILHDVRIASHYTRYFELSKEFNAEMSQREPSTLAEMCATLGITTSGDLNQGLECCKAMAEVLIKLLQKGRKFMIPEVIWNIFDRPNPPLEKRNSLSPKSAKILEATQPAPFKRRHEEEEEGDNETARDRKDVRERQRETEAPSEPKEETATDQDDGDAHPFPEGTVDAVVRLRGLPWSIKEEDIRQFFKELTIPPAGVYFEVDNHGKRSGEGYIRFMSTTDAEAALKYDKKHIGSRYVEVFPSSLHEMAESKRKKDRQPHQPRTGTFIVKMRGLPFSVSEKDITQFFRGIKFPREWVTIVAGPGGRATGEAFVEFQSEADLKKAMQKDREKIGTRYVELFISSASEMSSTIRRAEGSGRGSDRGGDGYGGRHGYGSSMGGGGYGSRDYPSPGYNAAPSAASAPRGAPENFLYLRGLPFAANEVDVVSFFATIGLSPIGVQLAPGVGGRPSGEAFVQLATVEDLRRGLGKHLHLLGGRPIEVSPSSTSEVIRALGYDQRGGMMGGGGDNYSSHRDFGGQQQPPQFYPGNTVPGAGPGMGGAGMGGYYGGGGGNGIGGGGASYMGSSRGDLDDLSRKRARY